MGPETVTVLTLLCFYFVQIVKVCVFFQAYKNFEIPTELQYTWRYLKNAYATDAFMESCPADREIISHYTVKAASSPSVLQIPAAKCLLMGEYRTFSVPDETLNGGNGYHD